MDSALPLQQSPEFARAAARLGGTVALHEAPGLHCLVQQRRMRLGTLSLVSRGPVVSDPAALGRWLGAPGAGALILNAGSIAPQALRAAGFWPIMTPATLGLLPLGAAPAMRAALAQKWRNRLNRAEAAGLRVTRHALGPGHWLLRAEAEQARRRGYRGLPPAFCAAYAETNPGRALVFEAWQAGAPVAAVPLAAVPLAAVPVAAVLVLVHGAMATWQIGVSLPEGRRLGAMNLLLWRAMTHLAAQGVTLLDLGILNADDAPGLAHFKLGTGARAHRLSGTWARLPGLAPLARRLPLRLAA